MRFYLLFVICIFLVSTNQSFSQSALYLENGVELKVGSGATITVNGQTRTRDNGVDTSALNIDGILEIKGDFRNNGSGKFVALNPGKILLNGTVQQIVRGKSAFNNLEIDNVSGVRLNDTTEINNLLTLSGGNLNTVGRLILNATATKTASIGPILTGSISGDVTVEAFIENEAYDYRFLTIPVQNKTLDAWSDDILMTGFTGTPYPTFHFNSVYFYDETLPGDRNARYTNANNVTDAIPMGVGVQAYIGAADLLIDVTGPIYTGAQNLPVTFTNDLTQNNDENGWNLVGNPYPSTIDWDSPEWTKNNINDAVYIYEGSTNSYQTYINGVGTNGGSRYIPSSQAFWVKATDSPILMATEQVKVNEEVSFVERLAHQDLLRLRLSNGMNNDEIVVRYNAEATSKFDNNWDAFKLKGNVSHPILTAIQDSTEYSILSLNSDSMNQAVFLQVEVPSTGVYTIYADELPRNANCLVLEDLFTGRVENLRDSASYTFHFYDTTTVPRFKLTASKIVDFNVQKANCFGDSTFVSVQSIGNSVAQLIWEVSGSVSVDSIFSHTERAFFGNKKLQITVNQMGCGTQIKEFDLYVPDSIQISIQTTSDTGFSSGAASAAVVGGTSPYQYNWSMKPGYDSSKVSGLLAGSYYLIVEDAKGCLEKAVALINGVTTSIAKNELNEVTIFPNPVQDQFEVQQLKSNINYSLRDINGKELKLGKLTPQQNRIEMNRYSAGTYFLYLSKEKLSTVIKINKI